MKWYLRLFSAALEVPAFTFGLEQKAKKPHSNSIAGRISRARRKRQRLPSSLLIENASDQPQELRIGFCPRRFRSSLATNRLRFDNQSDEGHPVHLHRHTFELTRFAGKATAGVMKDVIVVPAKKQVEVDFTADNPGPTLFHCHQQLHMDYGFMAMVQYVG
jgi:hypothetical protein